MLSRSLRHPWRLVAVLAIVASAVALLVQQLTSSHEATSSHSRHGAGPHGAATGPSAFRWDDFDRSDRALNGDLSPTGARYYGKGIARPVLRHHRFVMDEPTTDTTSGGRFSILMLGHHTSPTAVAARFTFTPGHPDTEAAVVGTCPRALSSGSVQFWVRPTSWQLLTLSPRRGGQADHADRLDYAILGRGTFARPLKTDGRTVYTTVLHYDQRTSSVVVSWPGERGRRFHNSDPNIGISANWGRFSFAQIISPPGPVAGNVNFLAFGSN